MPNKYGKIFNFIRRNRLAVWRQLPKLIPAGSTPVSCSIYTGLLVKKA